MPDRLLTPKKEELMARLRNQLLKARVNDRMAELIMGLLEKYEGKTWRWARNRMTKELVELCDTTIKQEFPIYGLTVYFDMDAWSGQPTIKANIYLRGNDPYGEGRLQMHVGLPITERVTTDTTVNGVPNPYFVSVVPLLEAWLHSDKIDNLLTQWGRIDEMYQHFLVMKEAYGPMPYMLSYAFELKNEYYVER